MLCTEWVWNIYSFIKEAKSYGKECVNHIHSTYMKSDVKRILRETVKKITVKNMKQQFWQYFFECNCNCSKSFICIVCLIRFTFSNDLSIKVAPFEFFIPVKYNVPFIFLSLYYFLFIHYQSYFQTFLFRNRLPRTFLMCTAGTSFEVFEKTLFTKM